jgi:hypothetical protein
VKEKVTSTRIAGKVKDQCPVEVPNTSVMGRSNLYTSKQLTSLELIENCRDQIIIPLLSPSGYDHQWG